MPARTRASAVANRVYSSPTCQQQVKFRPGKQNIRVYHSLCTARSSLQQTLTQIDFVNPQTPLEDEERFEKYEEAEITRKRKRRRTEGNTEQYASKYHTQTLTQLEFVTPGSGDIDVKDEDDDEIVLASPFRPHKDHQRVSSTMGPPKTPSRRRVYEVPSSQSPVTPSSIHSQRYIETRSPLTLRKTNLPTRISAPAQESDYKPPKLEIRDTFSTLKSSPQENRPRSPALGSTPKKQIAPAQSQATPSSYIKQEIQDSDYEDEYEEEIDIYNAGEEKQSVPGTQEAIPATQASSISPLVQNSQLELVTQVDIEPEDKQTALTDTQEAEEQLQSTMLQFTQRLSQSPEAPALASILATSQNLHYGYGDAYTQERNQIRPSQATTVDLSVHDSMPYSSPSVPRPPLPPALNFQIQSQRPLQIAQSSSSLSRPLPPFSPSKLPRPHVPSISSPSRDATIVILDSPSLSLGPSPSSSPSPSPHHQSHQHRHQHRDQHNHADQNSLPQQYQQYPHHGSSPETQVVPLSLPSSQLLTRSQMLPDSLMQDSVPFAPLPFCFVEDSEDEGDEGRSEWSC